MKTPLTGGCACGAIRYDYAGRPLSMFYCHCRDCQQASGGPFVVAVLALTTMFRIVRGEPTYFTVPSDKGGTHTRGFCPTCGSRLFGAVREGAPFIGITAASLDDPRIFKPKFHFFMADAQPWDVVNDGLPQYDTYPPEFS